MTDWKVSPPAGRSESARDVLMREVSPLDNENISEGTQRSQVDGSSEYTVRAGPHWIVPIGIERPTSGNGFSKLPNAPHSAINSNTPNSHEPRRPSNIAIKPLDSASSSIHSARFARLSASPYHDPRTPTPVSAYAKSRRGSANTERRPISPMPIVPDRSVGYSAFTQTWSAVSSGGIISQLSATTSHHPGPRRISSDSERIRRLSQSSGMDLLADAAFLSPRLDVTFSPSPPLRMPAYEQSIEIIPLIPLIMDFDTSFIDSSGTAYRILQSQLPLPIPTLTSLTSMRAGHVDVRDILSLDPVSFEVPLAQPRYKPTPQSFIRPISQLGDVKPFPITDIDAYITQQFLQCYYLFYLRALDRNLGGSATDEAGIRRHHWLSHNSAMIKSVDIARHIKTAYSNSLERVRLENTRDEARQRDIISPLFQQVRDLCARYHSDSAVLHPQQLGVINGELARLIPFCLPCDGLAKIPYVQLDPGVLSAGFGLEMRGDTLPAVPHSAPLPVDKPSVSNEQEVFERTRRWAEVNSSVDAISNVDFAERNGNLMWSKADQADVKLVIPVTDFDISKHRLPELDSASNTPLKLASTVKLSLFNSSSETYIVVPCHRYFLQSASRALREALSIDPILIPDSTDHLTRIKPRPGLDGELFYVKNIDLSALAVIMRWMYLRDDHQLIQAMKDNIVSWQNLARTVKMLDMIDPIKVVIGDWWRKWIKVDSSRASAHTGKSLVSSPWDGDKDEHNLLNHDSHVVEKDDHEMDWELDGELALAMAGL